MSNLESIHLLVAQVQYWANDKFRGIEGQILLTEWWSNDEECHKTHKYPWHMSSPARGISCARFRAAGVLQDMV